MPRKIQDADVKGSGDVTGISQLINDTKIYVSSGSINKTLNQALTDNNIIRNPMTTGGDVIYGGASGVPTRLANGTVGQVLTSAGGTSAPTWSTGGGFTAPSAMTDVQATQYGLKQYLHGTNYNGGNAPTVTGTSITVVEAHFFPYQLQDGGWRLKFNIHVNVPSASRTSYSMTVNGVTFSRTSSISGSQVDGGSGLSPGNAFVGASSSIIYVFHSTFTTDRYSASGDVKISAKPSWAY